MTTVKSAENFLSRKPINKLLRLFALLISVAAPAGPAVAEAITIPLEMDYPLLRQWMLSQLSMTEDQGTEILHDPAGCSRLVIADPQFREQKGDLEISMRVTANIGTDLLGACRRLFDWNGQSRFLTEPVIQPDARSLKLHLKSLHLINAQGMTIDSGPLWNLAERQLKSLLEPYVIDLNPAINELSQLIPKVLNRYTAEQMTKIVDSLGLAAVRVQPEGMGVDIGLTIEQRAGRVPPETAFTEEELQQLEDKWHMMDAMLTYAVKRYAATTHQPELRDVLREILLDARYQLRDALAEPVNRDDDPVRHWFVESWQKLGPVMRRISMEEPGQEHMLLLSLLTATNALAALDRLGPDLGLDISADGLRRMGRLLIDQSGVDPLHYDEGVDPELRELFQMSPEPDESDAPAPPQSLLDFLPIRAAWAGTDYKENRLYLWVPKQNELPTYLLEIRSLLLETYKKNGKKSNLDDQTVEVFRHLILTTAWQESCWRQFVSEKGKVVPLRSDSGDLGLMQVNEHVWRGFYDVQKLRWDIAYNAKAGAEILLQYMLNYALKKEEHKRKGGVDNLARASYSAYNSGPGQASRYRNPKAKPEHQKIDKAFWSKYQYVKKGQESQVANCFGADVSLPPIEAQKKTVTSPSPIVKGSKPPDKPVKRVGNDWVKQQKVDHFTLQFGVFSSKEAAEKFLTANKLQGTIAVATIVADKMEQFVVLAGSYPTRDPADKEAAHYSKLKPWVRQFIDIKTSLKR